MVYLRKRINVIGRCKLIIPITYYSCDKKRRFKWYATPAPSMNLCFSDYSLSHGNCEIFSDIFFSHLLSHIFLSHFSRIFVLAFSFSHFFVWEIFASKTVDIRMSEKFRSFLTFETLKLKTNSRQSLPLILCVLTYSAYCKNSLISCDL